MAAVVVDLLDLAAATWAAVAPALASTAVITAAATPAIATVGVVPIASARALVARQRRSLVAVAAAPALTVLSWRGRALGMVA